MCLEHENGSRSETKRIHIVRFIYVMNCNLFIWMDDMPHTWVVRYAKQSKVSRQISYDWVARNSITEIVMLRSIFFQSSHRRCFHSSLFSSLFSYVPYSYRFWLQSQYIQLLSTIPKAWIFHITRFLISLCFVLFFSVGETARPMLRWWRRHQTI